MLKVEKKLWKKGYNCIVGLDEAGRGPWAGPLVVGAVSFPPNIAKSSLKGIKDSKKLKPKDLEKYYTKISQITNGLAIGIVESEEIDLWGIAKACQIGMFRALANFNREIEYLLLDANIWKSEQTLLLGEFQKLNSRFCALPHQSFRRGEEVSVSIAAASIVAKATRDRLMVDYAKQFPVYGFEKHKGYGTRLHQRSLHKFGRCKIHRLSFRPVRVLE